MFTKRFASGFTSIFLSCWRKRDEGRSIENEKWKVEKGKKGDGIAIVSFDDGKHHVALRAIQNIFFCSEETRWKYSCMAVKAKRKLSDMLASSAF